MPRSAHVPVRAHRKLRPREVGVLLPALRGQAAGTRSRGRRDGGHQSGGTARARSVLSAATAPLHPRGTGSRDGSGEGLGRRAEGPAAPHPGVEGPPGERSRTSGPPRARRWLQPGSGRRAETRGPDRPESRPAGPAGRAVRGARWARGGSGQEQRGAGRQRLQPVPASSRVSGNVPRPGFARGPRALPGSPSPARERPALLEGRPAPRRDWAGPGDAARAAGRSVRAPCGQPACPVPGRSAEGCGV